MGLIETIFAAILVAAISRLAADEFKAWTPSLIDLLVRQAIREVPVHYRERYAEEWRGHIEDTPADTGKLVVSLSILVAAWKLSRILPKVRPTTFVVEETSPVPVIFLVSSNMTLPDDASAGTSVAKLWIINSDSSPFTGPINITDEIGKDAPVVSQPCPPMTLRNAAIARARFYVRCLDCRHGAQPDPAEMAQSHGAETTVWDWRSRLVCSQCGGSQHVALTIGGTEK